MTWYVVIMEYFKSLFSDENQYVTWTLVLLGWFVAYKISCYQLNSNEKLTCKERLTNNHNESVRFFKEKLSNYEDLCMDFWSIKKTKEQDPQLSLLKIASKLKELTETAKEIEKLKGIKYPSQSFLILRRFTTTDSELQNRPLKAESLHLDTIRKTCGSLRKMYRFKE